MGIEFLEEKFEPYKQRHPENMATAQGAGRAVVSRAKAGAPAYGSA